MSGLTISPNILLFSLPLSCMSLATKQDLRRWFGRKKGRRKNSRRWDVQTFSESRRELFKRPRRWIQLNHSTTFEYFFQRFNGFMIKFAPHVAEEFQPSSQPKLIRLQTEPCSAANASFINSPSPMLSVTHVLRCRLDKRSDSKPPAQITDKILYTCSHKESHKLCWLSVCLFFYF